MCDSEWYPFVMFLARSGYSIYFLIEISGRLKNVLTF